MKESKFYTWSGHRYGSPYADRGIEVNSAVYAEIDGLIGPSSWTVIWFHEGDRLFWRSATGGNTHEIGSVYDPIFRGKSYVDILLSDVNILANFGRDSWDYIWLDWKDAPKGTALGAYMRHFHIKWEWQDNSDSYGFHGFTLRVGNKTYTKSYTWCETSKGYESMVQSLKKLVDWRTLQPLKFKP